MIRLISSLMYDFRKKMHHSFPVLKAVELVELHELMVFPILKAVMSISLRM